MVTILKWVISLILPKNTIIIFKKRKYNKKITCLATLLIFI